MIRVALLAPIANSLYSRLVAHLAEAEENVQLAAIVVRTPWNLGRIKGEFRRDGARLIQKVRTKLVARGDSGESQEPIGALADQVGLGRNGLKEFAGKRGIPYLEVLDHNAPAALAALRAAAPDAIAFTGGGMIRKELLAIPRLGVLNCHAGILPEYRGMDVVEWPAAEGRLDEPGIGLTLHWMDTGLDTGPILLRKRIALEPCDDFASIRRRIPPELVALMIEGIRGLRDGRIEGVPQEVSSGRQYYVMHPRIRAHALEQLRGHLPGTSAE